MSAPLTQVDIEAQIVRQSALLEKVTHELRRLGEESARARTEYDVANAKALLEAEGAIPARQAQATIDTADLLLGKRIAEALERAAQEAGRNRRATLDALRSLNSNLRGAIAHAEGVGS